MSKPQTIKRFLSEREILKWADAHRETTAKWSTKSSGLIPGTKFESWAGATG